MLLKFMENRSISEGFDIRRSLANGAPFHIHTIIARWFPSRVGGEMFHGFREAFASPVMRYEV